MIETERLILREWRAEDAAEMKRHCNTPAVMRWLGPLNPPEYYVAMVARQQAMVADHGHCFWVVERKEDGAFLGMCGIKRCDPESVGLTGEFEIGWRLREDAWGKGYAREAATAALDHAFGTLGAKRVIALTVDGNSDSWGLMLRLGMVRRPDLDFDDPRYSAELNPTIVYVIGADQWRT